MKLKAHDLQQLDEVYIRRLPETAARDLCVNLLVDLKEARERLEQNASNSSRPPSSRPPWEYGTKDAEGDGAQEDDKTKTRPASESAALEPNQPNAMQSDESTAILQMPRSPTSRPATRLPNIPKAPMTTPAKDKG